MFQTQFVKETKTHFTFSNFFSKNRVVYEIMWKKCGISGQATDDNKLQRMRFACWMIKAIETHSEYLTLYGFHYNNGYMITPQYTYIACLVCYLLVTTDNNDLL